MKTMRTTFMLLFSTALFWACVEDNDDRAGGGDSGCGAVVLSFVNDDWPGTRAVGDSVATAAEKQISTAKIFIFNSGGTKMFERSLSLTEVQNLSTTPVRFLVPNLQASTPYNYYVIANKGNISATSFSNLQAAVENDIASYNGTWAQVADGISTPLHPGGFVMQGNATASTTSNLSDTVKVAVVIKRVTAKLDISTTIDNTVFGSGSTTTYPGTVAIDSIKVQKTQASTPLIPATPTTSTGTLTLGKQVPNVVSANSLYQNRFYIFENGNLAAGNRVTLAIYGTYTFGAVVSPVVYSAELTGGGSGQILRNGAYKINLTIKGMSGTPVAVTVTVSNWETMVTQSVNLGS